MTATRPVWLWLGQLGVIVLGAHLAADRLDDVAFQLLASAPISWESVDTPAVIAGWAAVVLELLVVVKAGAALLLTPHAPKITLADWWERRSVEAFVLPAFWAATALAGSWVIGMAAEDALAEYVSGRAAAALGWVAALAVGWRLGLTGWVRIVGALEPGRPTRGLLWAPLLLLVGWLALRYGLPVWGWL